MPGSLRPHDCSPPTSSVRGISQARIRQLLFGSVAQYRILLPMQETQVPCLGGEDPLEEGMATHSSNLAWRISWTEEPGGLQSLGSQRVKHGTSNFLESQLHVQEFCPSLIPGVETYSCEVKSLSHVWLFATPRSLGGTCWKTDSWTKRERGLDIYTTMCRIDG